MYADHVSCSRLEKSNFLDDLASLDPDLYNGLIQLKNYTGDVEKDLSLTFAIDEQGTCFFESFFKVH
jgi:hypothetical protein